MRAARAGRIRPKSVAYSTVNCRVSRVFIGIIGGELGLQTSQRVIAFKEFPRNLAQLIEVRHILGIVNREQAAMAKLQRVIQGPGFVWGEPCGTTMTSMCGGRSNFASAWRRLVSNSSTMILISSFSTG